METLNNYAGDDGRPVSTNAGKKTITVQQLGIGLLGLAIWYIVYKQLLPFSHFFS